MPTPRASRPASIELIGGHPALDLVNTVSWRDDAGRRRENLATPSDLFIWTDRVQILDARGLAAVRAALSQGDEAAQGLLGAVHELRESLHHHLAGHVDRSRGGRQIEPGSVLHRAIAGAVAASTLAGSPGRWNRSVRGPLDLVPVLALEGLDLIQTMSQERLRRCDGDGCGWLFLDTTRNHSRRWCSSGECGNRARARRHYARTHTKPDRPSRAAG